MCLSLLQEALFSIFAIVYTKGTLFTAALAGLFNKFIIIIALTIIFIAGNFLCIIAPNYHTLAASRIIMLLFMALFLLFQ